MMAQFESGRNLRCSERWWKFDRAIRYLMAVFLEAHGKP
jgi:hypothetical protein